MQIKKSELRSVIKEQVAAFFVTPQPFGTVSRNTNLEGSLRKFDTDEVDEKELTKVIKQTMAELEEEASKRMRSTKLKESKINGKAKGHGNRVKEVEQHWMTKFESILKRKAPKLVGRVEEERAQYMQTMGYTPEDAVRDIVRPGSLERSNHNKIEKSKCAEGMMVERGKIKKGDLIHIGLARKGGAGYEGRVTKKDGHTVYVRNKKGDIYKGPLKNVTYLEEISGVDSLKPNDPHTPEDEAEKDAADDVMEAAAEGKRITALRKIVKTQKPGKVDRQTIDLYTASDLVKLYDGAQEKYHSKFEKMPIGKLVEFLNKVWRKGLS